jgi:hypothetical protein
LKALPGKTDGLFLLRQLLLHVLLKEESFDQGFDTPIVDVGEGPKGPKMKVSPTPAKSSKLNPFDLKETHSITRYKTSFAKLKLDIQQNGIKEPIKHVVTKVISMWWMGIIG